MAQQYPSPKTALRALFERIRVPAAAVEAFDEVLSDDGTIVFSAIGRHPLHLGAALPSVREIPVHFRRFLVEGLRLAEPSDATLEQAVVSTRRQAAAALGCEASWDAILERPDEVRELARRWREAEPD